MSKETKLPDEIAVCPKCRQYVMIIDGEPKEGEGCFDINCCTSFDQGPALVVYVKKSARAMELIEQNDELRRAEAARLIDERVAELGRDYD